MPVDHSLTYTDGRLRNLAHRSRLRRALSLVDGLSFPRPPTYADVGCSNGYMTARIAQLIGAAETRGYDHSKRLIAAALRQHPGIAFRRLDLNVPVTASRQWADLVTCFETLEHVGALDTALDNVLGMAKPGGTVIISVPIEVGPVGLAKYIVKRATGYTLNELGAPEGAYLRDLLLGRRISVHRPQRDGFGTHFGFDHRDVTALLSARGLDFTSWTTGTTRFFKIAVSA